MSRLTCNQIKHNKDKTNIYLEDLALHFATNCITHTTKNTIQKDISSWLKLLYEVSGKHMIY